MTKSRILVTVALLCGMAGSVFSFDSTKWEYRADVIIEDGTGEYCGLSFTPDIYNAAKVNLGDIRLVDGSGEQVPYVLAESRDITEELNYTPAMINRSTNADKAALVTLDFDEKVVKNSIEVETKGDNFRRAVKIEGSNDNVEFFTLVERAYVFAVDYDSRFSKVYLPTNDYRYLRIAVSPMAEEEQSPVIENVTASRIERMTAEQQTVEMTDVEHTEDDINNLSIYKYDIGYRRLPISEIELDVADDVFYRHITIEGRDAAKRKVKLRSEDNRERYKEVEVKWQRISSDAVYRYSEANEKTRENLVLHIPSRRSIFKHLRFVIRNYDDKPLTVKSISAKMTAHKMVFAAGDNVPLTLYVGSKLTGTPRYDLQRTLSDPLKVSTRTARLGGFVDNPLFSPVGEKALAWTEKHKVLLLIILVATALVLGGFILKSFKSIQKEQAQGQQSGKGTG